MSLLLLLLLKLLFFLAAENVVVYAEVVAVAAEVVVNFLAPTNVAVKRIIEFNRHQPLLFHQKTIFSSIGSVANFCLKQPFQLVKHKNLLNGPVTTSLKL